jgi:hypothetical protein
MLMNGSPKVNGLVVRLITSQRKILLLQNHSRGGQGLIWAVAPLDGWMDVKFKVHILFYGDSL